MPKFQDLTGLSFGNLKVIELYDNKNYQKRWKCQCVCGNITISYGANLKRSKNVSCGCIAKKEASIRYKKDIKGQRFGKLLVISENGQRKQGGYLWLCECDCGNFITTFGGNLRSGVTNSCGCQRIETLKEMSGNKSPSWKGGKFIDKQGYVNIYCPGHKNSNGVYVKEHIKVVSDFIKRPLTKKETVHHKNGIRNDNRIENLELWASDHGSGQRVQDLISHSIYILEKYSFFLNKQDKEKILEIIK